MFMWLIFPAVELIALTRKDIYNEKYIKITKRDIWKSTCNSEENITMKCNIEKKKCLKNEIKEEI